MKIAITGSSGMLGEALCARLRAGNTIEAIDIDRPAAEACNIADRDGTIRKITNASPGIVIHAAAYTNVDECELKPDLAYRINVEGTKNVMDAAAGCGAAVFYISTDYVFDGKKDKPYTESDTPNPISIYGKTKLEAEKIVSSSTKKFFIIRSSWLFGSGGRNFPDQIIKLAKEKKQLRLVNDKYGCPTFTCDLACALDSIISRKDIEKFFGIYHITNNGTCSWFDFAKEALKIAGIDNADLAVTPLKDFPRPASVPKMSALDCGKFQKAFAFNMRPWQEALTEHLSEDMTYRTKRT